MLRWLSSFFTAPAPPLPPPVDDLPPAKVAIIGAGLGGCFAAKFLCENGGKDLDIHVFAKKGSKVGGRTAVCKFDGHLHEIGGIVFHSSSQYMMGAIKQHGLTLRPVMGSGPYGIFNGKFMFVFGRNPMMLILQLLWRYGWDICKLKLFISRFLRNFCTIYSIQDKGTAFVSVEDMAAAMGGEEMSNLVKYSAYDYFHKHLLLNSLLVNEFIPTALRMYYAQGITANASITAIAHSGFDSGNLVRLVGGNYQVAECVLKESGASLTMEDVISVTKTVQHGTAKYSVTTGDGKTIKDYDVVIVAHPINTASIKYENFSNKVYTAATTIPYQRQIVTLCKGKINQEYFKEKANSPHFPQYLMTTDALGSIGGVVVELPSEITMEDASKYMQALKDDPVKVWKVYSSEPLTPEQCQSLFPDVDPKDNLFQDWAAAYPKYTEPYHTASFILDDGVFYINAIELAFCCMEGSAIGAKNVSLLARNYLLQQNSI